MDIFGSVGISVVAFIGVFSALVFFHELGHFWVARRFGVRIEAFSIGFGPSLVSWHDKHGVNWRIAALPLGGYVKFFGDADGASTPSDEVNALSEAERQDCFHYKPLYQRALIVAAGPIANFILAIVIYAGVYMTVGQPFGVAQVTAVQEDSAAQEAGFKAGDIIVEIDNVGIGSFGEMADMIAVNPGRTLDFIVLRDGQEVDLVATPRAVLAETPIGEREIGRMGLQGGAQEWVQRGPFEALWYAGLETRDKTVFIIRTIGELITGNRSIKDLGGPLQIGHVSGQVAQISFVALLLFAALLSINLGLINLLPIPMLDGGHLLYYACEAVRGKPLGERVQEYGFRLGLALVLTLMVVVTWNDIVSFVS